MAKILAFDTSTDACSAALLHVDKISSKFVVASQKHTYIILSMIDELMSDAGIKMNELDVIAFGRGPGSFTGIRLATSVAQGLAFAADIPVIGISTLRALAQEVFVELQTKRVLVAQDARMQEIYFGQYEADAVGIMQPVDQERLVRPLDINIPLAGDWIGVGSGFEIYGEVLLKNCDLQIVDRKYVQAKYMLHLAAQDFARGLSVKAEKISPVYLREKVAWV